MKNIVGVKFQSKYNPEEFSGREYSYFVADGVSLKEGDIVPVTIKNGDGLAMVARVGIKESEIDERVMPYMRTIDSGPVTAERHESAADNDFFKEV